jgi:hypothetical protein
MAPDAADFRRNSDLAGRHVLRPTAPAKIAVLRGSFEHQIMLKFMAQ